MCEKSSAWSLTACDHLGVAVADVHDADAGGEVDVLSALDVGDHGVSGLGDVDGRGGRDAARDAVDLEVT